MDLRQQFGDFGAAGDGDVAAMARRPADIAGELDDVPKTLVGDQQQRLAGQWRAVPLFLVGGRHQRRHPGDAVAPLVFLPARRPVALQQQRLGEFEMRAGHGGVEHEGGAGAGDGGVDLHALVMDDGEVVVRHRVRRRQFDGAFAGRQRVVQAGLAAVDFADVAQIQRRLATQRDGAFHQRQRLRGALFAEGDDAGEVQHVRLLGGGGERVGEQAPGLRQPSVAFEFGGDGKNLAQRHGNLDRRGFVVQGGRRLERKRVHHSTV